MDIYYTSVGRNSNLLLNVPPDRRGRIHPNDSLRLMEFRAAREEAFRDDLLAGAAVTADNTRGASARYAAATVLDGNYETWWTTDDDVTTATLEFDLEGEITFDRLMIQEYIPLGQRVESFTVKYSGAAGWRDLARATTVGYKRILRFPAVTAHKIRIEFKAAASPVISAVAIYDSPEPEPVPAGGAEKRPVRKFGMNEPITIDLGGSRAVEGFFYIPNPTEQAPNIYRYDLQLSEDGKKWTQVKSDARFDNIANSPVEQKVLFDAPQTARYIRIVPLESVGGSDVYEMVEAGAVTRP
jgi:alpha-L-fucosidase